MPAASKSIRCRVWSPSTRSSEECTPGEQHSGGAEAPPPVSISRAASSYAAMVLQLQYCSRRAEKLELEGRPHCLLRGGVAAASIMRRQAVAAAAALQSAA